MNTKKTPAVETKTKTEEKVSVEFTPFGATEKIKLSATMIREFIAVPTKSGALPSARDCVKFLMLCRGKRANPFEGDCFLIGYDSQNGPSFSMVCGIELFLKRAERSPDYDGRESGVIVESGEAGIIERQGSVVFKNETLLGGWAKIYRKNHSRPEYKSVKLSTYNTDRSRWEKDPGGQIEKVALSQALRQAYPTALGGLYTQEEMQRVTESGEGVMTIKEPIAIPEEIKPPAEPPSREPGADPDEPLPGQQELLGKK
jgi:phage recombination protein Bet